MHCVYNFKGNERVSLNFSSDRELIPFPLCHHHSSAALLMLKDKLGHSEMMMSLPEHSESMNWAALGDSTRRREGKLAGGVQGGEAEEIRRRPWLRVGLHPDKAAVSGKYQKSKQYSWST